MNTSTRTLLIVSTVGFVALTVLTALLTPALVSRFYPLPVDQGPAWYFWQLSTTTGASRTVYWAAYAFHQLAVWVLLIRARAFKGDFVTSLRDNWWVVVINLLFAALHLVQTHIWYDGLAQDVPIWTSQGSVIVMLVLVLFLEIPRRGLFWGKKATVPPKTHEFLRKWHGIFISWALVYTFWFHPMDGNWGLLSGFIYMFLLFTQVAIFNTKAHSNLAWVVVLEFGVVVHGTLITVYKDNPIWPMFMFGFLIMFVFTQMHVLKWARKLRWVILGLFVVAVGLVYGFVRGFEHIYELTFIPVALYGGALLIWLVGRLVEGKGYLQQP